MWRHKVYTALLGNIVKPVMLDDVATVSDLFSLPVFELYGPDLKCSEKTMY